VYASDGGGELGWWCEVASVGARGCGVVVLTVGVMGHCDAFVRMVVKSGVYCVSTDEVLVLRACLADVMCFHRVTAFV
jgi:hypothetical protein